MQSFQLHYIISLSKSLSQSLVFSRASFLLSCRSVRGVTIESAPLDNRFLPAQSGSRVVSCMFVLEIDDSLMRDIATDRDITHWCV